MSLTPEQVTIIRSTVPVLKEHGNAITSSFYSTLLKEVPALNNVFNHTNQVTGQQAGALAGALYAYASHIDDLGALSPAVEKICQKHASLYIQPEQYETVGTYLLRAMGDVLGAALTTEIHDAWAAAYWQLANIMIKREDELLREGGEWKDWREFRIADKVRESEVITSFYLKPADGKELPAFLPGQYISILTDVPKLGYLQPRQYSLSDAPHADYYRISVKKEAGLTPEDTESEAHPGYISNVLHDERQVGDVLKVSHPEGEFFLDPQAGQDNPVVLLSAGVGLTPMISMLNTLVNDSSTRPISFVHGARSTAARSFHQHVKNISAQHRNVNCTNFLNFSQVNGYVKGRDYDCQGRLELGKLDQTRDLFLNNKQTQYFICGPESFNTGIETGLKHLGVDQGRIRVEGFGIGSVANA